MNYENKSLSELEKLSLEIEKVITKKREEIRNKNILELQRQLTQQREKIRELNRQKRELNLREKLEKKIALPSGRPKLKTELIERAREMAKTKPLADVALSLDVSCRSLYRHGISRRAINAESSSTDKI